MKSESIFRRAFIPNILFVVLYWGASFMLIGLFLRAIYSSHVISAISVVIAAGADASLFVLPFLWIPPRWRWLALLAILLLSGWLYANVLYFRNFSDVIPASLYSLRAIANEYVRDGIFYSVRLVDLLYLLPLSIVAIATYLCSDAKPRRRFKTLYIFLSILLCLLAILLGIRRNASWNAMEIPASLKTYVTTWRVRTDWHRLIAYYGIWGYGMNVIENRITEGISLTPQQRCQIACEMTAVSDSRLPTDVFFFNRGKNLIIIIVESLGSSVLSLDNIPQIAPNLNNIVNDTVNFVVPDMRVVAGYGRSADGQFTCNTGLYPLSDDAFTLNYATADYPSLAKALIGYDSQEIICESRNLWQHSSTTLSYGFGSLIDNAGSDAEMFSRAIQSLSTASKPIYLFLTTIAMHDPYDKYNPEITPDQDMALAEIENEMDRNYLSQLAYFDNQLGGFLTDLQQKKFADRSIIVITGDHEPSRGNVSELIECTSVPFVILNPGKAVECARDVSQIDIFPTLLDVMGVGIYVPDSGKLNAWRGFGRSLFVDDKNPLEEEKLRALSDTIVRSRWFLVEE